MTDLKQGHFFSPINHTLDGARAITACGLIFGALSCQVFFFSLFFTLPVLPCSLNVNLFLSPIAPLRVLNLITLKSEIILHPAGAAGGIFRDLLLHSDDQYCHL